MFSGAKEVLKCRSFFLLLYIDVLLQIISAIGRSLCNTLVIITLFVPRVFILLSCIGQRSLSNSGVLEGLLNLLDNLLSPLQQPQASAHGRTEGSSACLMQSEARFVKEV